MKTNIKTIRCEGSRFFILKNRENLMFGFDPFELDENNNAEDLSPIEKKMMVESLYEVQLETKLAGSIIKSEIRYLLLGCN